MANDNPFASENRKIKKRKRGMTPRGPMSKMPDRSGMSSKSIIGNAIEAIRYQTSPVGPGRAERAAAYKADQELRRKKAREKVGPSYTRRVGAGDQGTRGRGRGR